MNFEEEEEQEQKSQEVDCGGLNEDFLFLLWPDDLTTSGC